MSRFARGGGAPWTRLIAIVTLVGAALALAYFNAGVVRGWISLEAVARRNATATITEVRRAVVTTDVSSLAAAAVRGGAGAAAEAVDLTGWKPVPEKEIKRRCAFTKGEWCGPFLRQRPIAWRPPPLGKRSCLWNCTFVGVCDATRGWCRCPAGWTGDDCGTRMKVDRWHRGLPLCLAAAAPGCTATSCFCPLCFLVPAAPLQPEAARNWQGSTL